MCHKDFVCCRVNHTSCEARGWIMMLYKQNEKKYISVYRQRTINTFRVLRQNGIFFFLIGGSSLAITIYTLWLTLKWSLIAMRLTSEQKAKDLSKSKSLWTLQSLQLIVWWESFWLRHVCFEVNSIESYLNFHWWLG